MQTIYTPFQPTLTNAGLARLGLSLQSRDPCRALAGKVHSYLQIKADKPTPYPVMPDGTYAIYISDRGSMIGGALTEASEIPLLQAGEYFGIWFCPAAVRYFFDLDLSEIAGAFVDEKYFCSHYGLRLHNEIYRHDGFASRAEVCERWLVQRYSPRAPAQLDFALSLIYRSHGNEKVRSISDKVGWSSRHLNRQFLQHTGLTPKTFCQIIRVQHACKQLYAKATMSKNLPLDAGYYDQPHMIKEFRKRFNLTPGDFIRGFMSDFYNR